MHEIEEWLSITEAAARLSAGGDYVDRSTLSRYLKQHSEALPTRGEGKANLVELGALKAHRSENVRLRQRPAATGQSQAGQGARPGPAGRQTRFPSSQSDGAARKAIADAEMREMDLAERRGQLTPVDEVDQGGRDAIALMLIAFDRAVESDAAAASVKYGWDERVVRIVLKGYARHGLEAFNREIRDRLDALERKRQAGGDANAAVAAPLQ